MTTEAQGLALAAYIATLLPTLRLSHWQVKVQPEPASEGHEASVSCTEDRYIAAIRVSQEFWTLPPETQRNVITHELIHVHNSQVDDAVILARKPLGEQAWALFWGSYAHADEYATDALAAVLAPFLPLPELPPAEKASAPWPLIFQNTPTTATRVVVMLRVASVVTSRCADTISPQSALAPTPVSLASKHCSPPAIPWTSAWLPSVSPAAPTFVSCATLPPRRLIPYP